MKQYTPVGILFIVAVVCYGLHKLVFSIFTNLAVVNPVYRLETLYGFFTVCSLIVVAVSVKISKKSFDNVGMVFLIATSLKMVLCYLMLRPILSVADETLRNQKISFFMLFILFLAIETVITIRILNNKQ